MKKIRFRWILLIALSCILMAGCTEKKKTETSSVESDVEKQAEDESSSEEESSVQEAEVTKEWATIEVTSESLKEDGRWLSVITKSKGENVSPQLSWDEVEGATSYAICMVDESAGNWMHWKARGITTTSLEQGAELENSRYVGPYPPSGNHKYVVYVYALAAEPDKMKGFFDGQNASYDEIETSLDTAGGVAGNILAKGSIEGNYQSDTTVE